jgi:hypothetical protein
MVITIEDRGGREREMGGMWPEVGGSYPLLVACGPER